MDYIEHEIETNKNISNLYKFLLEKEVDRLNSLIKDLKSCQNKQKQ